MYKDLSTDMKNPTVDCYTAASIETQLGLSRSDLISLALLVGCDYCPQGVPGVGRTKALTFIASCKPRDSLDIMRGWSEEREMEQEEAKIKRSVPYSVCAVAEPCYEFVPHVDMYRNLIL